MSLYYVQKLIYELNRNPDTTKRFDRDREALLADYDLTDEELIAIRKPDIGLLYVLGVNGQILMHYAALWKIPWDDYLKLMENGIKEHGPVRNGLYAQTEGKK